MYARGKGVERCAKYSATYKSSKILSIFQLTESKKRASIFRHILKFYMYAFLSCITFAIEVSFLQDKSLNSLNLKVLVGSI